MKSAADLEWKPFWLAVCMLCPFESGGDRCGGFPGLLTCPEPEIEAGLVISLILYGMKMEASKSRALH